MAEIYDLNVTDASNTARFPENQAPSTVNDGARALEGLLARHYTTQYGRNRLVNGGFSVAQRGTTFDSTTTPANSDDTYLLDRWILLSDGNDVVDVSQDTSVKPTGAYASMKCDVETANLKFGIVQILEARDAASIIGGTASLSFKARRTGTSISHLRAGVAAWDSTADSVTSDLVSAWGAAGTNPTLATNWTFENTPANLATLTTSFQTFRIENISIDTANATNVAVFIWIDDTTTTVGDFLYIADVQLEPGNVATNFERDSYLIELSNCQRYYQRANAGVSGVAWSTTEARLSAIFVPTMRSAPTLSLLDTSVLINLGGASVTSSGSTIPGSLTSASGSRIRLDGFTGLTAGEGAVVAQTEDWLELDAEL